LVVLVSYKYKNQKFPFSVLQDMFCKKIEGNDCGIESHTRFKMSTRQEKNDIGTFIDNTPNDVLVMMNKMAFEQLLDDKFASFFKKYKDDLSQLYAFYVSIANDLQAQKSFRAFMQFFIKYIEKKNITVKFGHGTWKQREQTLLCEKTLDSFILALLEIYRDREFSKKRYCVADLWKHYHVTLGITIADSTNYIPAFWYKVVKESHKSIKLQYEDFCIEVTELVRRVQNIVHTDHEIQQMLERELYKLEKMTNDLSAFTQNVRSFHSVCKFEEKMEIVDNRMLQIKMIFGEYMEDPTDSEAVSWAKYLLRLQEEDERMRALGM
jgi:hypothetical protein